MATKEQIKRINHERPANLGRLVNPLVHGVVRPEIAYKNGITPSSYEGRATTHFLKDTSIATGGVLLLNTLTGNHGGDFGSFVHTVIQADLPNSFNAPAVVVEAATLLASGNAAWDATKLITESWKNFRKGQ